MLYTAAFLHNFPIFTVRARSARPCREAASHEGRGGCAGPFVPPRPRLPCVRGPQRSAASGGRSDHSGPAATCLAGLQHGPGRLSGNPELAREARLGDCQPLRRCAPYPLAQRRLWASTFGEGTQAAQPSGPMWASAPTGKRQLVRSAKTFTHRQPGGIAGQVCWP